LVNQKEKILENTNSNLFIMDNISIIVTGRKGEGKSTFCWQLLKYLYIRGIKAGGIITLQNGKKSFYLVSQDSKIPFETNETENFIPIGYFRIHKENMEKAISTIRSDLDCDFLFLDEIGLLELHGKGYHSILDVVISRKKSNILVVKKRILDEFQDLYPRTKSYQIIHIKNRNITPAYEKARKMIEKQLGLV
jgi:nucleoside-triphosphatase THEP1